MFFEIRKFPIFRRFDVFWQKNDDFSENSSYAYLHVFNGLGTQTLSLKVQIFAKIFAKTKFLSI